MTKLQSNFTYKFLCFHLLFDIFNSMKTANFITSSCRHCRYYQSEGRRGGTCNQLSVPVQAEWAACTLAAQPFSIPWDSLEDVMQLEQALALKCAKDDKTRTKDRHVPDADVRSLAL